MFNRVGFFHFGHGHSDAIDSLTAGLAKVGDVSNSLVVLPEAFNIGKRYRDLAAAPNFNSSVLHHLCDIAFASRVSFVAALVIDDVAEVNPPYSSVYYISTGPPRLMCRKGEADDCHGVIYTAFGRDACDIANPIEDNGACIAAMICMDIQHHPQRLSELETEAVESGLPIRVFCVPAHMDNSWWPGLKKNDELPAHRQGIRLVVANSNPSGRSSFITDPSGVIINEACGETNRIVLAPVGEIRDPRINAVPP